MHEGSAVSLRSLQSNQELEPEERIREFQDPATWRKFLTGAESNNLYCDILPPRGCGEDKFDEVST